LDEGSSYDRLIGWLTVLYWTVWVHTHQTDVYEWAFLLCLAVGVYLIQVLAGLAELEVLTRGLDSCSWVEIIWVCCPAIWLSLLAILVIDVITGSSDLGSQIHHLAISGNQWFWVSDSEASFLVKERGAWLGDLRVITCSDYITVVTQVPHLILLNSLDVIHCLNLLAIGIKCDCTPGRSNGWVMQCIAPGIISGQCSEICGFMHGHMPLTLACLVVPCSTSACRLGPACCVSSAASSITAMGKNHSGRAKQFMKSPPPPIAYIKHRLLSLWRVVFRTLTCVNCSPPFLRERGCVHFNSS
jgi:heme/copper-type cytochrome/quinol oxidase subunit 2